MLRDRHMGDLGNLTITDGVPANIMQSQLRIYGSEYNILGRAIVIHELQDDLGMNDDVGSRTTGNSGNKIACGIIVTTMGPPATPTAKY